MATQQKTQRSNVTKLTVTAMLTAVAIVLQYLEFQVPLVPSFLKMDLSDIPELIGAFIIGPLGGVVIALVKNLVHLIVSQSGFVGELSNFMLGAAFSFTAGLIYKYRGFFSRTHALDAVYAYQVGTDDTCRFHFGLKYTAQKTKLRALIACIAGTLAMAAISFPTNYFIVYPIYAQLLGGMDKIIGLYKLILPVADTLPKALLIFNVPFTLVKGLLCAIATMLIYKPLSKTFDRMNAAINRKTGAGRAQ